MLSELPPGYRVNTNIVFNGFVAYRHHHIVAALKGGLDLICTTDDHPDEWMVVPNFIIERRIKFSKDVQDSTGASVTLDYIWWESEQSKVKVDPKQMKLI